MRHNDPQLDNSSKQIAGVGDLIQIIWTMVFYFEFAGRQYSVTLSIVLGAIPLIISQEDPDELSLNHQTYHKTADQPEDG